MKNFRKIVCLSVILSTLTANNISAFATTNNTGSNLQLEDEKKLIEIYGTSNL